MTFVRLGTACLVWNADGEVLLSQRGDLGIWNLPGGRLDRGEYLWDAAAREVREETGIEVEIIRPVGLYYVTRWHRMNTVFEARAVGGQLLGKTTETRDNRWFPPDALPQDLSRPSIVRAAISGEPAFHVIETPQAEYRRYRRKFALRWVRNLLAGRPEPRFPRLDVNIVGIIHNGGKVLAWDDSHLPRINPAASSDYTLWQWLKNADQQFGVLVRDRAWTGIWQDAAGGKLDFIFRATTAQTITPNGALTGRDAHYVLQSKSNSVWMLDADLQEV